MIAKFNEAMYLFIYIYRTDIPQLKKGKSVECISIGKENWFMSAKVSNETKREYQELKYSKNKSGFKKLEILINPKAFEHFINNEVECLGTRGLNEKVPFDRMEIYYYSDQDGINISKNLDPLTINPELRKQYFLP